MGVTHYYYTDGKHTSLCKQTGKQEDEFTYEADDVTCNNCLFRYYVRWPGKYNQAVLRTTLKEFLHQSAAELINKTLKQKKEWID